MSSGGPSQYTTVVGTGTPPTSPNFGAPRFSGNDPADFWDQVNGVTDTLDAQAAKRGAIVDADIHAAANIAKTKLAPLDVMDIDVDPAAAIAESKLALASDAAPGTPSRRTLGAGAQQACAGNDPRLGAGVPIGTVVAYSGQGDPVPGAWVVADGRLIDRTQFAAFFAATGHAYNGGVDPGSNKVKIPDKRGKHSIGAINMGTGAGANDNAHVQYGRGQVGGEVNHVLSSPGEIPSHAHGISDPGHGHGISDPGHAHSVYDPGHSHVPAASGANFLVNNAGNTWGLGYGSNFYLTAHGYTGGASTGIGIYSSGTGVGVNSSGTGVSVTGTGSSGGHNNVGPYECDCYIVRIS